MTTPKKKDELPTVVGVIPDALVNFVMNEGQDDSLETLRHHRILNRIAIVQGQSKRELKAKFPEGTAIVPAADTVICQKTETFDFTPVMFFDEFITWADRNDKTGPKIIERSLDRAGIIALKASDPNRRKEAYGDDGKLFKKHTHHLNFLVVLQSGEQKGTLAVLSFSRGEFKTGMKLIGMIKARKINSKNGPRTYSAQAPLWATRWTASIGERKNDKGEWYGFDTVAAENPWIDDSDLEVFRQMHEELKKDYKEQALSVGHEAVEDLSENPAEETEM